MFFHRARLYLWNFLAQLTQSLKWIVILTLPLSLVPIMGGIVTGINQALWMLDDSNRADEALKFEKQQYQWQSYMSVPGALTMQEFQAEKHPFQVPGLSSFDWEKKLHVLRPIEDSPPNATVNQQVSLDHLVRENADQTIPRTVWVYVTGFVMPDFDAWDHAFQDLVQYSYVHPLPGGAQLMYLECASSEFLCLMWKVKRRNTLIQFEQQSGWLQPEEQEDDPLAWVKELVDGPKTYTIPKEQLDPVRVRAIDLPLESTREYTAGYGFPSELDQLKLLVYSPEIAKDWAEYNIVDEEDGRFAEHLEYLQRRYSVAKYFYKLFNLHRRLAFAIDESLGEAHVLIDMYTTLLIQIPIYIVLVIYRYFWGWFIGKPGSQGVPPPVEPQGVAGNWMNDIFAGAMLEVMSRAFNSTSDAGKTLVTSAPQFTPTP